MLYSDFPRQSWLYVASYPDNILGQGGPFDFGGHRGQIQQHKRVDHRLPEVLIEHPAILHSDLGIKKGHLAIVVQGGAVPCQSLHAVDTAAQLLVFSDLSSFDDHVE